MITWYTQNFFPFEWIIFWVWIIKKRIIILRGIFGRKISDEREGRRGDCASENDNPQQEAEWHNRAKTNLVRQQGDSICEKEDVVMATS